MAFSTEQTYVVSGNLISAIATDTSAVSYEDLIHSNLLAQMGADKKLGSRFVDPTGWLSFYKNTVGNLFWSLSEQGTSTLKISAGTSIITVPQILAQSFFKQLSQEQIDSATASIDLFNQLLEDDPAFILYNLKSHAQLSAASKAIKPPQKATYSVNLQISIAHTGSEIALCNVFFQTSQAVSNDLFTQKFTVKDLIGNINVYYLKAQISESNYAKIRQQVIEKLGENIDTSILLVADDTETPAPPSHAEARSFIRSLKI
ncbi:hypothetical protein [Alcaligenes parafaecalis]|uniref:DUF1828 domain-containing protein n=1 Tax=Alcaligenes parafaecalis TaxID=171260 RepID=A0ABT3VKV6_9BURK|nr:hypothetical protein [Alcaligenes parafaecalis]MCX5463109.1 hypothetical protein [Alcaligenes parafaecalis]